MITPLQKVLLLRPVTYLLRGKPVATDHIVAGDGMTLEADDAVERVLVKVDGKTVYRVAYANVAGDVPADPFGIAKDGPTTLSGERVQSSDPITKDTLIAAAVMAAEHGNYFEQADPSGLLTEEGRAKVAAGEPLDPTPPGLDTKALDSLATQHAKETGLYDALANPPPRPPLPSEPQKPAPERPLSRAERRAQKKG